MAEVKNVAVEKQSKPIKHRWYLGGVAGCMAIMFTHPLDLLKVHLQTQTSGNIGLVGMGRTVVKNEGFKGLYAGLSASQLRQITYSNSRFGLYEVCVAELKERNGHINLPFYQKLGVSAFSGFFAGIIGNPADMINVRMQNDSKLLKENRRNYKNAFDGMYKVVKNEGALCLFNGASMTAVRGLLMTMGQVGFYDQGKQMLLSSGLFTDNLITHFVASSFAGTIATIITQPFDVMKTRLMNAKGGEYKNLSDLVLSTRKEGIMAFYKGFVPAWTRLLPQTILIFVFLEQLRKMFPIKE